MNHTWLGVFVGFVLLGLGVLMGLTIFHGQDLVMQRENWELAQILVPSTISIVGWMVTIWWALRQIEISSEKNRQLQHETLQSNEKIKAIDAIIVAYVDINKSLHKIKSTAHNLKTNIDFKEQGKANPDLHSLFHESGNAYSELFECIAYLQFNLIRLIPYGIHTNESFDFIDEVQKNFSKQSPWLTYQENAASYLQNENSGHEELFSAIDVVASNCEKLCLEAFKVVSKMYTPNK